MGDEKMELKPCPFCGGNVQWCGDGHDDFEPHTCDHIHCYNCGMHFSNEREGVSEIETIEELRVEMLKAWNTRAGEG